jgi:tRNA threonylcarbamoyladenosine biosynthesis protein TsaB
VYSAERQTKQKALFMRILALDTSTGPASAALLDGGTLIATHEDTESMRQSQQLVAAVDTLVRENGGYDAVDAMTVNTGPGGFTGIRVALAAARGFALSCNIPLLGITSLESFAWQALEKAESGAIAAALINAFRQQVYAQVFIRTETGMTSLCEAQAVDADSLPQFLSTYPSAHRIGNIPEGIIADVEHHAAPHARHSASYANVLLEQAEDGLEQSRPAEAFYIRPPDAKPQKPLLGA